MVANALQPQFQNDLVREEISVFSVRVMLFQGSLPSLGRFPADLCSFPGGCTATARGEFADKQPANQ